MLTLISRPPLSRETELGKVRLSHHTIPLYGKEVIRVIP